MQAVLDVVLPVFGIVLAGYRAGHFRILGAESSDALNRFVDFFALPALLFLGTARMPVDQIFNLPFKARSQALRRSTWPAIRGLLTASGGYMPLDNNREGGTVACRVCR